MDTTSAPEPTPPARRRTALFWASAACAAGLAGVAVWMLAGNPAVLGGHPLLPGILLAAAVAGVAWGIQLWRRRDTPRPRSRVRAVAAWAGRLAVLALAAGLAWLNPFAYRPGPAAEAGPASDFTVTETPTAITMSPGGRHDDEGAGLLSRRPGGCPRLPGHPCPGRGCRIQGGHPEGTVGAQPV